MSKKEIDSQEHKPDCLWYQDWHACNCGVFEAPRFGSNPPKEHLCLEVIPDTFIMCGEMGQYCSQECMKKASK
mgnify:CR=1 FL=1